MRASHFSLPILPADFGFQSCIREARVQFGDADASLLHIPSGDLVHCNVWMQRQNELPKRAAELQRVSIAADLTQWAELLGAQYALRVLLAHQLLPAGSQMLPRSEQSVSSSGALTSAPSHAMQADNERMIGE